MVDTFIDLANQHADNTRAENVGMALLYAASRYNTFTVASHAQDLAGYTGDQEKALAFFSNEYERMFGENYEDYKKAFDTSLKYEHLVKKT